ncbi:hypothetical protein OKW29_002615 [Paraburkholderia sp. CI3]
MERKERESLPKLAAFVERPLLVKLTGRLQGREQSHGCAAKSGPHMPIA